MFTQHVKRDLSAFFHGELPAQASRRVAEHLITCDSCRTEYDQIKFGVELAESLPLSKAPESLWNEVQSLIDKQDQIGTAPPVKIWLTGWLRPALAVATVLLLVIGAGVIWIYNSESQQSWEVVRLDGTPVIGAEKISDSGWLGLGQWLETDASSRAKINVGAIGQVELDPNTRVRLLETRTTEHRLELARGKLTARIWAPPRLFFVDTPSAIAADLGCAYTLEVDDEGGSLLHVTSGWVALQLKNRESIVPAEAMCATRPGIGPGTPYFVDAPEGLRAALARIDFGSEIESNVNPVDVVLREARPRDTLTLWHLLERVERSDRERVYERLAAISPPPQGVTREGVLELNYRMLDLWRSKLESSWSNQSLPKLRKAWSKIWTRGLNTIRELEGNK
ncbi:MAG TPA: FecR domain-containing protein [Pyrinomonadaceae bacterium]|nr:FecR domain-containing protein [Pyrinomonadaceae bacterium]